MTLGNPWAVDGGALHPAKLVRTGLYASTSGVEGVVTPDALKVTQTDTPSGQLKISAGACLILNRYPGGAGQTYCAYNDGDAFVSIAPTAATPRNDLVCVRILDPEYEGDAPPDPTLFDYTRTYVIQGVSPTATSVAGLPFPAYAVARVNIPAYTSVFPNSLVTDLRVVANPLTEQGVETVFPPSPDRYFPAKGTAYALCPPQTIPVAVPTWATTLSLRVFVNGMQFVVDSRSPTLVAGVKTYAGTATYNAAYLGEGGILTCRSPAGEQRQSVIVIGKHNVTAFRGSTIYLGMAGLMSTYGNISVDYQTQISFEWTFHGTTR